MGLENQYLIVLRNGREVGPYVKGRERVASSRGGRHGGSETGDLSTGFARRFQYQGSFWVITQKSREALKE